MRPTCDVRDPHVTVVLGPVKRLASRERIGVKQAAEPRQMIAGPFALAVWTVAVECRRRPASIVDSGIDGIDLEPRGDRAPQPRRQTPYRGIVGV
jgi:hypothetical protein